MAHLAYAQTLDMGYQYNFDQVLDLVQWQTWAADNPKSWEKPELYVDRIIDEILCGVID